MSENIRQAICICGYEYGTLCAIHGSAPRTHADGRQGAAGPAGAVVDAKVVLRDHRAVIVRKGHARRDDERACGRCKTLWCGDAETGGCDARLLALRVVELEGAAIHRRQSDIEGYIVSCGFCMLGVARDDAYPTPAAILHREWCPLRSPATGGGWAG